MIKYYVLVILFLFITSLSFTQQGLENIKKVYASWTTDFNKRSIEFDELIPGGPPKDGIPAIIEPKFTTIEEAGGWLDSQEPVISVSINGSSKAYPLQILIFHEIVNDRIGRTPLLISFCPLCYSAIVFDRTLNGMAVKFGVSGLLRNSDLVMYDQLSESFWQQFTGEAIVGDFTGQKLKMIPSQIISFEQYSKNYSDGLVLSKNTGFKRPYGLNPYQNYDSPETKPFLYRGEIDERLPQNEKVIGIKSDIAAKAYPYSITQEKNVINDKFNGQEIVIFHIPGTLSGLDAKNFEDSRDVGSTGVYKRILNDQTLNFKYEDGKIIDNESGSVWSITGESISGKFKGQNLEKVIHGDYFSFAWLAFMPNSLIYTKSQYK